MCRARDVEGIWQEGEEKRKMSPAKNADSSELV